MLRFTLLLSSLLISLNLKANTEQLKSSFYNELKGQIHLNNKNGLNDLSSLARGEYVDLNNEVRINIILKAADEFSDSMRVQVLSKTSFLLKEIPAYQMSLAQRIQRLSLYKKLGIKNSEWIKVQNQLRGAPFHSRKTLYSFFDLWDELPGKNWKNTFEVTKTKNLELYKDFIESLHADFPSKSKIQDLFYKEPPIEKYKNGYYKNKPRLYMFCRRKREHPCMMLMRNRDGSTHYEDGEIWHQPSLGYSSREKPSHKFNGHTPAGVWRIDGVMPRANKKWLYGSWRRLILHFIAPSPEEKDQKYLIPQSNHEEPWWRPAVVARDVGRGLFRIHGTWLHSASYKPYYPFYPTAGCVAQRENTHDGINYDDQRLLLDELMEVSGMEPKYKNEPRIRGLFYVLDIDDKRRAVTLEDLKNLGLE